MTEDRRAEAGELVGVIKTTVFRFGISVSALSILGFDLSSVIAFFFANHMQYSTHGMPDTRQVLSWPCCLFVGMLEHSDSLMNERDPSIAVGDCLAFIGLGWGSCAPNVRRHGRLQQ